MFHSRQLTRNEFNCTFYLILGFLILFLFIIIHKYICLMGLLRNSCLRMPVAYKMYPFTIVSCQYGMFYFQGCWLLGKSSRSIYFSLVRSVKLNPTPNIPAFSKDWKIFSHRKNNTYIPLKGYFEKGKVGVFVQSQRRV